jgi:hypothetical protein
MVQNGGGQAHRGDQKSPVSADSRTCQSEKRTCRILLQGAHRMYTVSWYLYFLLLHFYYLMEMRVTKTQENGLQM